MFPRVYVATDYSTELIHTTFLKLILFLLKYNFLVSVL